MCMRVNGKEIPLKKPQTLQEFLLEQGYRLALIAVEHNDVIVPKADYATVLLSDSDVIEVVPLWAADAKPFANLIR